MNCHVLAKIIHEYEKPELFFLGLEKPNARGEAVFEIVDLNMKGQK